MLKVSYIDSSREAGFRCFALFKYNGTGALSVAIGDVDHNMLLMFCLQMQRM